MYQVRFFGLTQDFTSLLPAMEKRQSILSAFPDTLDEVEVWEWTGDYWTSFDADKFLDGLRVLLAPAE